MNAKVRMSNYEIRSFICQVTTQKIALALNYNIVTAESNFRSQIFEIKEALKAWIPTRPHWGLPHTITFCFITFSHDFLKSFGGTNAC
jgi:hypothetical protein